jgi:hypothetical protein
LRRSNRSSHSPSKRAVRFHDGINLAVFDGAGAIVLLASTGWVLFGAYRIHVLKNVLRHRVDNANPQ